MQPFCDFIERGGKLRADVDGSLHRVGAGENHGKSEFVEMPEVVAVKILVSERDDSAVVLFFDSFGDGGGAGGCDVENRNFIFGMFLKRGENSLRIFIPEDVIEDFRFACVEKGDFLFFPRTDARSFAGFEFDEPHFRQFGKSFADGVLACVVSPAEVTDGLQPVALAENPECDALLNAVFYFCNWRCVHLKSVRFFCSCLNYGSSRKNERGKMKNGEDLKNLSGARQPSAEKEDGNYSARPLRRCSTKS